MTSQSITFSAHPDIARVVSEWLETDVETIRKWEAAPLLVRTQAKQVDRFRQQIITALKQADA